MTREYSIVIKRSDGSAKVVPVEFARLISARSIRITPNMARHVVRVTYPIYVLRSRAAEFLESKKDWIAAQLDKMPERTVIADGAIVPLLGRRYKVTHIPSARRGVWVEDSRMFVSGEAEFLNRRVKDFIRAEMKRYFAAAAKSYARALGVSVGNVNV
ncbi:MAG: M48 family metallopeptidase, partial [Rickettsiales bacterium]|nr:M48 family metallopeptidase [Rickettsiales bacterium]